MKKCGKILRDGWHNLRAGRSTEGPVFSNPAATKKEIGKSWTVYCNDMYKRLKIGKDGTCLDKDGAAIETAFTTKDYRNEDCPKKFFMVFSPQRPVPTPRKEQL